MGKRGRAMGLCTSKDNDAIGGVATPAQVAYFAHLSKIAYEPRKVDLDSNVRCVDSAEHGYRLYVYKNKHITVVCRATQIYLMISTLRLRRATSVGCSSTRVSTSVRLRCSMTFRCRSTPQRLEVAASTSQAIHSVVLSQSCLVF